MLVCPLCARHVESFHKRSHLLPEWMYTECYDEKHKILEISRKSETVLKKQKGIRGSFICTDCEDATQRYDHYASLILTDRSPDSREFRSVQRRYTTIKSDDGKTEFGKWENVDFSRFQKFVLSIVLRTHFAGKLEGPLQLSEKHLRGILSIYRADNAQDDLSYPILVTEYSKTDKLKSHVVLPYIDKKDGHHVIEFAGGGYIFNVYVSSHSKPRFVRTLRLKSDGSMYLVVIAIRETGLFKKSVALARKVKG